MPDLLWCLLALAFLAGVHLLTRRKNVSGPAATQAPRVSSAAGPEALTTPEQAMLAVLAERYGHGDPKAGRQLADYLRTRAPGVSDTDLMRCVIALGHVARYFHRRELTATDALAAYLHAMSSAALDLTAIERNELPR